MTSRPSMDDLDLLRQFESLTLPLAEWTHRSHVKVAYLYLRRHPFAEALEQMRARIKAYNAANQVPESPTRGYNETTTRAFLQIIFAVMQAYGSAFPAADADAFCDAHPQLMSPQILRLFYSPERRMHPDAKTKFVEPDLAPLPRWDE